MKQILIILFSVLLLGQDNKDEDNKLWISPFAGFTSSNEFIFNSETGGLFFTPVNRLNRYNFGLDLQYKLKENSYLVGGINYIVKGVDLGSFTQTNPDGSIKRLVEDYKKEFRHLSLPVRYKHEINLNNRLNLLVELGMFFSYVVDRRNINLDEAEIDYNKFDIGGVISTGLNFIISNDQKIELIISNQVGLQAPIVDANTIANSLNLVYSFKI